MLDVHKGTSRSPPPVSRRRPLAKEAIGIEVGKRWRFGFSSGVSPSILQGEDWNDRGFGFVLELLVLVSGRLWCRSRCCVSTSGSNESKWRRSV
ncbi:unnamed protein product [Musa banksii]